MKFIRDIIAEKTRLSAASMPEPPTEPDPTETTEVEMASSQTDLHSELDDILDTFQDDDSQSPETADTTETQTDSELDALSDLPELEGATEHNFFSDTIDFEEEPGAGPASEPDSVTAEELSGDAKEDSPVSETEPEETPETLCETLNPFDELDIYETPDHPEDDATSDAHDAVEHLETAEKPVDQEVTQIPPMIAETRETTDQPNVVNTAPAEPDPAGDEEQNQGFSVSRISPSATPPMPSLEQNATETPASVAATPRRVKPGIQAVSSQPVDVPAPAVGRAAARGGRVKTRLLGFNAGRSAAPDPFEKSAPKNSGAVAQFPVGWLVVTRGPGRGSAFTLFDGVSQIGRGTDQTVCLDFGDNSISRQNHAAIAYDSESSKFFIGQGGKANLVRLNNRPVLSTEEIPSGTEIRVGETTLYFVALCGESFQWDEDQQENPKNAAFS